MISAIAGPGPLLHQAQVELDDVGAQQRHEGQRHRRRRRRRRARCPSRASRTRSTVRSSSAGRAASARSVISRTTRSSPGAPSAMRQQVVERGGVEHLGLDVDEHGQRRQQALLDRAAEGRGAAEPRRARPAGPAARAAANSRSGRSQRALRAAGQRLVGDHAPGVELDDRLEHAAHAARRAATSSMRAAVRGRWMSSTSLPSAGSAPRVEPQPSRRRRSRPKGGGPPVRPGSVMRTTAAAAAASPATCARDQPLAQHELREHAPCSTG